MKWKTHPVTLVNPRDKVNLVSACLMVFSLFGFLGNVMIDYNWGTYPVVGSIALAYWYTLRWMIPFPINYWGVGAVMYFLIFLFSFAVLNRHERPVSNIIETIRLASFILILFELGVFYFVPGFMDKWVIQAVHGTWLDAFTNWDLLALALATTAATQFVLARTEPYPEQPVLHPVGGLTGGDSQTRTKRPLAQEANKDDTYSS